MANLLETRIVLPIRQLLLSGITPKKIALSLACGIVIGLFPIMGTTTALCALAAVIFKLNLPAIQLVNYFVYPAQLALILPFIRAGEFLLHIPRTPLSLTQMVALFRADHTQALHLLWRLALHGIFAWALCAPLIFFALYRVFLHSLNLLAAQVARRRATISLVKSA
jgi:uncharacterized protein (DUF2062 family)